MADLGSGLNTKFIAGAGLATIIAATAVAAFLGSPLIILVTTYAVAFGAVVLLFGDDSFARAVNAAVAGYAAIIVFVCTLSPFPIHLFRVFRLQIALIITTYTILGRAWLVPQRTLSRDTLSWGTWLDY
ncbi:hypothetical protein QP150_20030 [Sphingomonas sp. 22L2VL55-3]